MQHAVQLCQDMLYSSAKSKLMDILEKMSSA